MRNVSDKICRESQNPHFMLHNFFDNHAVYEVMWKTTVEPNRLQIAMWSMRIASRMPEAANTCTDFATNIVFILHQWLRKGA
jgi:hypothetical protein